MVNKEFYIARALLVVWMLIQVAAWGHHHETEVEDCEVGEAHFCESHVELHDCNWCHVVSQTFATPSIFSVNHVLDVNLASFTAHNNELLQVDLQLAYSRGPPSLG